MRILFVTNNYVPYSGGVVSSINASVAALQNAGHEVVIATLDFLGHEHKDPDYVLRVPCPVKGMYKKNHVAVPWRPRYHLMQQIQQLRPDIIHTHHPFLLGMAALKVARQLSIPIVFTYHTMYERYAHYVPAPQILVKWATKKRVLSFCKDVDGIILPSSTMQSYLFDNDIQTCTTVIPSGLRRIFLTQQPTIRRYGKSRPFKLLLVSRFTKEKNIPFVLDVMHMLQRKGNFELKLIGYGAEYDALRNYAYQCLGLGEKSVRFVHKPSQQELLDSYTEADLFLFSSTSDTQGLVLAEAMAGSTPVLAVDGPGQRDIIKNAQNGFLTTNRELMFKAAKRIAEAPDLHMQLQRGAWETARSYDPERLGARLIDFYRLFCSERSSV